MDSKEKEEIRTIVQDVVNKKLEQNNQNNSDNSDGVLNEGIENELSQNIPEDPLLTEYATQEETKDDDEKINVTNEWIGDDWKSKSKLSGEQIIALIQVRMLPSTFEELGELEPLFMQMVNDMEKYAVSHKGMAREQHVSVLRAMHGDEMPDDKQERNAIIEAFSAGFQSENEE